MSAFKEQLAELKTIIQVQQQQLQQMSALPAPNLPTMNRAPDLLTTIQDVVMASMSNLRAEIAELQNLYWQISTLSPFLLIFSIKPSVFENP
jgi:hypothetical protein